MVTWEGDTDVTYIGGIKMILKQIYFINDEDTNKFAVWTLEDLKEEHPLFYDIYMNRKFGIYFDESRLAEVDPYNLIYELETDYTLQQISTYLNFGKSYEENAVYQC